MSTISAVVSIERGAKVRFRDADYDPAAMNYWHGVVNDDPFLGFNPNNGQVLVYVPVYVHDKDTTIIVAGSNIAGVEPA